MCKFAILGEISSFFAGIIKPMFVGRMRKGDDEKDKILFFEHFAPL